MTPWKIPAHQVCPHGLTVYLVNGTFIRNIHDSDYSQGGNGFRYKWIPKNEIWIDAQISEEEWPFIIYHECTEVELMRKGMSYDRAHDQAKALEDRLRHEGLRPEDLRPEGLRPEGQNPKRNTMALAIYIKTKNDRNGNPKRGWIISDDSGVFIDFVDEGYMGRQALAQAGYGSLPITGEPIEVVPTTYRDAYRQSTTENPSQRHHRFR